ncbi:hypothetical protein SEPCBS119000_003410 [Sporothrix epigloea]|uniref:Something about silencing protein 4 domain-containing protein n=1 Tax=Sporothrix epigloea TaxID=1892477 RepID=A0ABP0DMR2_9PEZI
MLETLTILPMAPGTRSRRADVLHRATPVLLPKPKQRQTTLDEHLRSMTARPNAATTRPSPPRPALPQGLQQPPQQSHPPPEQKQRQRQSQPHSQPRQPPCYQQRRLSFSPAAQTHNTQAVGYADSSGSMSATRPKRKIAPKAHATAGSNDHASDSDSGLSSTHRSRSNETSTPVGSRDESADAKSSTRGAASRKRQRLAIEIVDFASSPGPLQSVARAAPVSQTPSALSPPKPDETVTRTSRRKPGPTNTHTLAATPAAAHTSIPAASTAPQPLSTLTATVPACDVAAASSLRPAGPSQIATKPTKGTASNAFKLELKSLQVSAEDAEAAVRGSRESGRKLRSQEASRFKSDLAAYFPDYDEVIGNEPKEEHILNMETPIIFVESSPALLPTPLSASLRISERDSLMHVKSYSDRLFYDVFDSHVLDFTFLGNQYKSKGAVDPLPDSYYTAHHKRAERLERSIRNTEKGRAKHEKNQIVRLLDELQGPDWLRTMGVSGITESKKKSYEPAREHFIRGCRVILEKFRLWSVEEKRRKQEKDREHAEAAAPVTNASREKKVAKAASAAQKAKFQTFGKAAGRGAVNEDIQEDHATAETEDNHEQFGNAGDEDDVDDDSLPESSDFDAVITQQLREEALARSRLASKTTADAANKRRNPSRATKRPEEPLSPSRPQEELTSFFQKRYQRDAALSRGRRKGRTVMAWGQPVPEVPEAEFCLPGNILADKATAGTTTVGRGSRGGARGGRGRGRGRGRGGGRGGRGKQ